MKRWSVLLLLLENPIMTPEEFEKLPVIGFGDTRNNPASNYTEVQKFFLPYVETYHSFLWLLFFGTLLFLITRFIILPLLKDQEKK